MGSMESTCHCGIAISAADGILFGNDNIVPCHKSGFGMYSSAFSAIGDDYVRLCNILRAKCSKQIVTKPAAVRFSNPGFGLLNFTYNEASVILEQSLYDFRNSIYYESEKNVKTEAMAPTVPTSEHGPSQQIEINTTTTP